MGQNNGLNADQERCLSNILTDMGLHQDDVQSVLTTMSARLGPAAQTRVEQNTGVVPKGSTVIGMQAKNIG